MRVPLLLAPVLLGGCISIHPPELPRLKGHEHGGSALHLDCGGCGSVLRGFVAGVTAKPPARPAKKKQGKKKTRGAK